MHGRTERGRTAETTGLRRTVGVRSLLVAMFAGTLGARGASAADDGLVCGVEVAPAAVDLGGTLQVSGRVQGAPAGSRVALRVAGRPVPGLAPGVDGHVSAQVVVSAVGRAAVVFEVVGPDGALLCTASDGALVRPSAAVGPSAGPPAGPPDPPARAAPPASGPAPARAAQSSVELGLARREFVQIFPGEADTPPVVAGALTVTTGGVLRAAAQFAMGAQGPGFGVGVRGVAFGRDPRAIVQPWVQVLAGSDGNTGIVEAEIGLSVHKAVGPFVSVAAGVGDDLYTATAFGVGGYWSRR